jgi:hypothetical protein
MLIDLHVHSTASDGTCTPEELLEEAADKGIEVLAITDHDTINGVKELPNVFKDVIVIKGVEISAEFNGVLHILGYSVDPNNERIDQTLTELQDYRLKRNLIMIEKMKSHGFDITLEELKEVGNDDLIGRPHFASLMIKKGYVDSYDEAFEKYLKKGALFYVDKKRLSPKESIEMILEADGIPVIAHPYQTGLPDEEFEGLIKELKGYGLAGIEVFYPYHTDEMIEFYLNIAKKYELVVTAGSDYHGYNELKLNGETDVPFELGMYVPYRFVSDFLCRVL